MSKIDAKGKIESNIDTVNAVNERVFGDHDVSGLEEFFAPDYVQYYGGKQELQGIDALEEYFEGALSAYPDISMETLKQLGDENCVVTHFEMSGTHEGPFVMDTGETIEPTGKTVTWQGFLRADFDGDKIETVDLLTDGVGVREQLGIDVGA